MGQEQRQKHNALFTLRGVTPRSVLAQLPAPKTDIETVTSGPGVIFWSASKEQLSKTTMMKLPKASAYQQMTVRNHNTVFKLLELFEVPRISGTSQNSDPPRVANSAQSANPTV